MRALRTAFAGLLALAASARAQEPLFVEIAASREEAFVNQPLQLRLRLGIEEAFLRENLIQPFRQRLDLPVLLEAPWLRELAGATRVPGAAEPEEQRGGLSLVLNGELARARRLEDRLVGARRFLVVELAADYLPARAGELQIAGPVLRFAHATRFEEDFLGDRDAVDRSETTLRGEPLALRIRPLPEAGRPPEFTGAVGRFSIEAAAAPRELAAGASLKLVLRVTGEGSAGFFAAPRLGGWDEFHVFGVLEDRGWGSFTATYDLTPLSEEVRAVPPIRMAFLDPGPPAAYRVLATEPIPLAVRPPPAGSLPAAVSAARSARPRPGATDIYGLKAAAGAAGAAARRPSAALFWGLLLAPCLLAGGLLCWLRARARAAGDAGRTHARGAAAEFRRQAGETDAGPPAALAGYLAARLDCAPPAVIGPGLPARLAAAGVPAGLAARAAAQLEVLSAARYGGRAPQGGAHAASALVDELEACFEAREEAP